MTGEMLDLLIVVEACMPSLLQDEERWLGLDVDYHPPRVERLWVQYGDYRINLHRIHPCEREEALFHPHPWPSAMKIFSGHYEMALGSSSTNDVPPIVALIDSSQEFCYEMSHPDGWHYVRPIDGVVMTLMVSGVPWSRESPKSDKPLKTLLPEQRRELFDFFKRVYS